MGSKSSLRHLRFGFSLFLLPVFLFAWSEAASFQSVETILCFLIIHLFFYPASNGFNSYYDKDEGSIGGLAVPPPVDKRLLWSALVMDGVALIAGLWISLDFVVMLLIIGLASKAYSHPAVRLKKYPIAGFITVIFFQGAFTFLMSYIAIQGIAFSELLNHDVWLPALMSSLMLAGSYPLTQVYQHEEDGERGDRTISMLLGVKGTFIFSGMVYVLAGGLFIFYYSFWHWFYGIFFMLMTLPMVFWFLKWFMAVMDDPRSADHQKAMTMNMLSSISLSLFFILMGLIRHFMGGISGP